MKYTNSNYSNIASARTASEEIVPLPAPSNLTATAINPEPNATSAKVQLNWVSNSNGLESGFRIERKTGAEAFTGVATVGKNVVEYIDEGLEFDTEYSYQVQATV